MDRLARAAVIARLIEQLRERGSWCGETHVQKATLFLQKLGSVPLEFEFIMYKHGPFSFDLRSELTSMRADELLKLEPQLHYGPRISTTERSAYIQGIYSKTIKKYDQGISFVAEKLGSKGVADLERLATALFVTQRAGDTASVQERAAKITALKPHVSLDHATAAVKEVDCIIDESSVLILKAS
jgi:hypothetical protein